jgi:hypothetical protein
LQLETNPKKPTALCCISDHAWQPQHSHESWPMMDPKQVGGAPVRLTCSNMQHATATRPAKAGAPQHSRALSPRCPHSTVSCTATPQQCRTVISPPRNSSHPTETTTQAIRAGACHTKQSCARRRQSAWHRPSSCPRDHSSTPSAGLEVQGLLPGSSPKKR